MATDKTFVTTITELANQVNAAIRRGQIHGPVVDVLNFSLINIGGNAGAPIALRRIPVRFALPTHFSLTTGEPTVAVQGILGNMGTKVPVEFDNIAGTPVPEPTGTPQLTSSNTSICTVTLDSDGSSVDLIPVQPPTPNQVFTVTYTLGSISFSQDFQVTADETATQGHFVTTQDSNFPLPAEPASPAQPASPSGA